jgi:hypothetical protein
LSIDPSQHVILYVPGEPLAAHIQFLRDALLPSPLRVRLGTPNVSRFRGLLDRHCYVARLSLTGDFYFRAFSGSVTLAVAGYDYDRFGPTAKLDWPIITNLRLDPRERTGMTQSTFYANWWEFEFWRGVFVQQDVLNGETAIEFPPMQKGANFNLEAVKEQIQRAITERH